MNWIVLVMALAASDPGATQPVETRPSVVTRTSAPSVQTGTLIFSQGDCAAVRIYTDSPFTHVGVVVLRNGRPFVYDSAKTSGVRCQTFDNYVQSQGLETLSVFQPVKRFAPVEARKLEAWLDQQLGRPYAITHFLTGERVAGVHCSEYVSEGLFQAGRLAVNQPSRVSPASLVEGITKHALYHPEQTVRIEPPSSPKPAPSSWCGGLWQDTCDCTADCWKKVTGTLLCW